MSVIVFHEKAGRSQVGSFLFSLDKVFFLPSLPLTPSFHPHSSCRPEAQSPRNKSSRNNRAGTQSTAAATAAKRLSGCKPTGAGSSASKTRSPPEQTEPQDEKEKLQQELSQPRRLRGRLRYGVGVLWANPQLRFQSALPSESPRCRRVLGACDWFFEH
jgi:hypothetical protein